MSEQNKPVLIKCEVVKCEPCRFIGKSLYARSGSSMIFYGLWRQSDWIFKTLDNLKEYATDDVHNSALMTWDKYEGKSQLLGYTIGRFMKANTPVPDGMDYFDIPETYIAKGFLRGKFGETADITQKWLTGEIDYITGIAQSMVKEEVKRQGIFEPATWIFFNDVYPIPDDDGFTLFGFYVACEFKNQ